MRGQSGLETACENLLYIRKTLEAAGQLTAISGNSMIAAGFIALAGTAANGLLTGAPWSAAPHQHLALTVWGGVLVLSLAVLVTGIYRKSLQLGVPIKALLVRKLLWSLCPTLFVGALLTFYAIRFAHLEWLPVIWLGCYGAAVTNGGQVSIAPVRFMGLCLMLAAAGAACSSPDAGLAWLAVGFGWLHIVFGAYIARSYNAGKT
ncbi:MAG TPA: hypothetical protein VLL97_02295 [Acidobacteriota bacterium]|nr:hypothetical protein [Acidobacteriota bacterium]